MSRRQTIWLTYQFVVTSVLTIAVVILAINKIADGEDVSTWVAVLIGAPALLAVGGWFALRAVKKE